MKKEELKKLIDTAAGRIPAGTVIKNCQIVNVFSGKIQTGDIAFSGDKIAGIGEYQVVKELMRREDMRFRDLLTATFILNLPMSARKSLEDC